MTTPTTPLRAALIGCGRRMRTEGATGCGMGREHVKGYLDAGRENVQLVALCDTNEESARLYQNEFGLTNTGIYTDYAEMLRTEKPDMVSVALWPHLHAPVVIACAEAGVRAIHCEKPMATTWGDARRMAEACQKSGTQLTFDHQRRFGAPFRVAKQMLDAGEIGDLLRVEATCDNLYDWGTHWFDMVLFFNDNAPVEWVLGQIEPRGSRKVFGAPVERQGISHFKFASGVRGLLVTGKDTGWGAQIRLSGTNGVLELGYPTDKGERPLRVLGKSANGWQDVPCDESLHGPHFIERAIADAIDALKTGREPELSARRALQATELIFATWESARRGGRVDLPLTIEDSPLQDLLDKLPAAGSD